MLPLKIGLQNVVANVDTYRIRDTVDEHRLGPNEPGVVEPQVPHSVELSEDAEIYMELWKGNDA